MLWGNSNVCRVYLGRWYGKIVAEVVHASSCVCSWCIYFVKCVQWHAWFASFRHPWGSHSRFLRIIVFCSHKCPSPDYNWDTPTHSGGEECRGTSSLLLQEVSQEICILRHTRRGTHLLWKKLFYILEFLLQVLQPLWQDGKWAWRIFLWEAT